MTEHMSWAPSRIFPTNLEPGGNPWTPIWGKSKIWLGYSLAVYEGDLAIPILSLIHI